MRAAYYDSFGAPHDVITVGEIPMPEPGAGEVRVRIHVSGINPSDVKQREGWGGRLNMPFRRIIPNNDGAGVIDAVGGGVSTSRLGERVWVHAAQRDGRAFGTAAEAVVVPASNAIRLPDQIGFDIGASLGVPALTAHRLLFADGPIAGQTVLVAGGAGTVGRCAVQLAKWGGATVIATVGSQAQLQIARGAGADHVFNYRSDDVIRAVRDIVGPKPAGVDRVVEVAFGVNLSLNLDLLKTNGIIATYASSQDADEVVQLPFYPCLMHGVTLQFTLVYVMPAEARAQAVSDITAALESGAFRPLIGKRFALDRAADAHEAVGTGGSGSKVIIEL